MNYLFLLSKDIISLICRLLASVMIARHLGPDIYGSYIFIILCLAYFQNFGRIPITISILPYLKNNPNHEKIIFSLSFFLNGIMGFITTVVLIFISILFNIFNDYSNWIYFLLSLMIFGEFYLVFISYVLSYQSKFKKLAVLTNIRSIILAIGFIYIYLFINQKSVFPFLVIHVLELFIGGIIGIILVNEYINLSFLHYKRLNLKSYLNLSLKFYLADKARFFSNKAIATIVAAKLSTSSLAYFNIIFSHFNLLLFPNNALGTIMYPWLSKEKSDKKQREYISQKIQFNFLIYIPLLVAAYFLYPKLVLAFYGSEYEIISQYFPIIIIIGSAFLILYPITHYFTSNGAPHYGALIGFMGLLFQIISVLFFLYLNDFNLNNAVLSQAIGFIGFSISLILLYNFKSFGSEND